MNTRTYGQDGFVIKVLTDKDEELVAVGVKRHDGPVEPLRTDLDGFMWTRFDTEKLTVG